MRTKSAYKTRTPDIEVKEEPIQPSETTRIEFTTDNKADPEAIVAAAEPPQPVDETTQALLHQISHLRQSEQLQALRAQQMAQRQRAQPPTREQKLDMWRQQGADEADLLFLAENPQMVDMHDLTRAASGEAERQGHQRGTESHRLATREIFEQHLTHQQAAPADSPEPAAADPAGFFRPRPAPSQEPAGPASYVSAPVSRQAPSTGYREPSPRSVRLSPVEQEIARNLGLSDTAYAAGKIRLQALKAKGELQ